MKFFRVIFFLFFSFSSCKAQDKADPVLDAVVSSNNILGLEIYKKIAGSYENVLISPLALSASLAMAYSGASGMTEAQMRRILNYLGISQSLVTKGFSVLLNEISTTALPYSSDLSIQIANSMWIQRSVKVLAPFKDSIVNDFKATVESADFFSPDTTRLSMNSWARNKSQGRTKEFIQRGFITRDMRFLLLSESSLRGKWKHFFDSLQTKILPFFPHPSKTITVQTMTKTGEYRFLRTPRYLALELPYDSNKGKNPDFSMILVLPILTYGLKDVENSLTSQDFTKILNSLELKTVAVSLPRFKIDSFLSLSDYVENLGITEAFSSNANFSKIDGKGSIKIDKILQRASISVDEKGTNALGATSISWALNGSVSFPENFTASHPFIFAIVDKKTKALLFIGRVVNPLAY